MVKKLSSPLLLDVEQDVLNASVLTSGVRPRMDQVLRKPFPEHFKDTARTGLCS